jgi:hypothetical protein
MFNFTFGSKNEKPLFTIYYDGRWLLTEMKHLVCYEEAEIEGVKSKYCRDFPLHSGTTARQSQMTNGQFVRPSAAAWDRGTRQPDRGAARRISTWVRLAEAAVPCSSAELTSHQQYDKSLPLNSDVGLRRRAEVPELQASCLQSACSSLCRLQKFDSVIEEEGDGMIASLRPSIV